MTVDPVALAESEAWQKMRKDFEERFNPQKVGDDSLSLVFETARTVRDGDFNRRRNLSQEIAESSDEFIDNIESMVINGAKDYRGNLWIGRDNTFQLTTEGEKYLGIAEDAPQSDQVLGEQLRTLSESLGTVGQTFLGIASPEPSPYDILDEDYGVSRKMDNQEEILRSFIQQLNDVGLVEQRVLDNEVVGLDIGYRLTEDGEYIVDQLTSDEVAEPLENIQAQTLAEENSDIPERDVLYQSSAEILREAGYEPNVIQ